MIDTEVGLVVALLVVSIPLVALARRAKVAYPIALVLGGLALGFVPGLPSVPLDPNVVLLFFLPPLLYWEAITAPTDVMLANSTQIAMLAFGLVAATTVVVAVVAHAIMPGLPWAAAVVLGAIVAPTDELAAVPVLERFRIPRHVIAIVEGESLINDALSLVLYAAAIATLTSGAFDFWHTALFLVAGALGSVLIGLLVGRLAVEGWRRITDTELQSVISLIVPFIAYIPAQRLGTSGVLEVVTTGVYVNRFTPRVLTPEARVRLRGFWETFVFVANALLFLLLGLQLHQIARVVFADHPWQLVLWYTLAVNLIVIFVRFAWVLGTEYIPNVGGSSEHSTPDWRHAIIAAWSGLRGAVSLAAALAIPLTIAGGAPFPERDLIIFITFSVIVVTLVGGGLTLTLVVKRVNVGAEPDEEEGDLERALGAVCRAAVRKVDELEREQRIDPDFARDLRDRYKAVGAGLGLPNDARAQHRDEQRRSAEREVIEAQRAALYALREDGEIDNAVLRRVLNVLDLAELRRAH